MTAALGGGSGNDGHGLMVLAWLVPHLGGKTPCIKFGGHFLRRQNRQGHTNLEMDGGERARLVLVGYPKIRHCKQ